MGWAVHAVIVPRGGAAVTPEELTAHRRKHIGGYKAPRRYEFELSHCP
jgi:acyl-CoA synthetase (AMP-forming)/AMP-acid ligase II